MSLKCGEEVFMKKKLSMRRQISPDLSPEGSKRPLLFNIGNCGITVC
jgi:hypothetical protein